MLPFCDSGWMLQLEASAPVHSKHKAKRPNTGERGRLRRIPPPGNKSDFQIKVRTKWDRHFSWHQRTSRLKPMPTDYHGDVATNQRERWADGSLRTLDSPVSGKELKKRREVDCCLEVIAEKMLKAIFSPARIPERVVMRLKYAGNSFRNLCEWFGVLSWLLLLLLPLLSLRGPAVVFGAQAQPGSRDSSPDCNAANDKSQEPLHPFTKCNIASLRCHDSGCVCLRKPARQNGCRCKMTQRAVISVALSAESWDQEQCEIGMS